MLCTGKHQLSVAVLSLVPVALVQYGNRLVIFPSTRYIYSATTTGNISCYRVPERERLLSTCAVQ